MSEPPTIWKSGSPVLLTFCGRKVIGTVVLASANARSLMLAFDGMLGDTTGAYAGLMPAVWDEERNTYRDLIRNERLIIEAG